MLPRPLWSCAWVSDYELRCGLSDGSMSVVDLRKPLVAPHVVQGPVSVVCLSMLLSISSLLFYRVSRMLM